ncbi:MAG: hypothetical protein ACK52K_10800 [Alphaproteobacteria bacterium]
MGLLSRAALILSWIRMIAIIFVVLPGVIALTLYTRYGGGRDFPDRSTPPLVDASSVEIEATLDEPPGNIAASADERARGALRRQGPVGWHEHQ